MTKRKNKKKKKKERVETTTENKNKTIFLCQHHTSGDWPMAWTTITWNNNKEEDQLHFSAYDKEADGSGVGCTIMLPYPNNLHLHMGVATAAWKSNLFFISGCDTSLSRGGKLVCVPTVCAFDTVRRAWDDHKYKSIHTPRAGHAAVVVGDTIYVFGSDAANVLPEHWGERFDILNNKWTYLPPPPHCFRAFTHAVYYQSLPDNTIRPLILLPLPAFCNDPPICVFDCITDKWLPDIQPRLPLSRPPVYSNQSRLSVIYGVLFWHEYGSIWGYDLIKEEALGALFTLPPYDQLPHDDADFSHVCLIHPGDQKLFLVWAYNDPYLIYCYKFGVQTKQQEELDTNRIRLVCEHRSVLHSKSIGRRELDDALVL